MIYGSVCSGIEAASVAWEPLGWKSAFLSEIELFPRAVLKHRFPEAPLHGDFTTIQNGDYAAIDLLVGGTPCQSFSVAGLRGGLGDQRGNLALQFLLLADRLRPRWVVWENVPGVLSSGAGRDFGSILGGLAELGYGFAYRVMDAQYAGVPQRRRRVFVVGHLGDWRGAAAVLFERESLSWHPAPSRKAGQGVADGVARSLRSRSNCTHREDSMTFLPDLARCLTAGEEKSRDWETCTIIPDASIAYGLDLNNTGDGGNVGWHTANIPSITLDTSGNIGVAHSLRADGFDASEDGTGRGTPLVSEAYGIRGTLCGRSADIGGLGGSGVLSGVQWTLNATEQHAVAFHYGQSSTQRDDIVNDGSPTLQTGKTPAVAFEERLARNGRGTVSDVVAPLKAEAQIGDSGPRLIDPQMRVRRLTPRECERLQGFPDVKKSVIIEVCNTLSPDHLPTDAPAETSNPKSPKSAWTAVESGLILPVNHAESSSPASQADHGRRVLVNAQIDLERKVLHLHSLGKLILSADSAEKSKLCRLPIRIEDFVRLTAHIVATVGRETRTGREGLPMNQNPSMPQTENGKGLVRVYGREIKELAEDAELFTTSVEKCLKFITSQAGQSFQRSEPMWRTLFYCVTAVINSFTPEGIQNENSYALSVETIEGWTLVPYRGKDAADGPRYRALGNSMAVPVMRWIGCRIQMVDEIMRTRALMVPLLERIG